MKTKATPAEIKRALQPDCEPPYHRPDCYGTNCDDEATRERCDPF